MSLNHLTKPVGEESGSRDLYQKDVKLVENWSVDLDLVTGRDEL